MASDDILALDPNADFWQDMPIDGISSGQYTDIFKEAIKLGMVPYDFRVWDRYLFSKCSTDREVQDLIQIHYKLLYERGIDAGEIGELCRTKQFGSLVDREIDPDESIPTVYCAWTSGPSRRGNLPNFSGLKSQWIWQAKSCLESTKCHDVVDDTLKRQRYPYLVFGMIVWRMKPWLDEFNYLDVYGELGYLATRDAAERLTLFNAYTVAFSRHIRVGTRKFEEYLDRNQSTNILLGILSQAGSRNEDNSFYRNIVTFLANAPENPELSVWRLKHALFSGLSCVKVM